MIYSAGNSPTGKKMPLVDAHDRVENQRITRLPVETLA